MKWFKHFTDASDGEFISDLESRYGLEGYARWFKLLEVVGARMGKGGEPKATFPIQKWCSFLVCKQNKLVTYLVHLQNQSKIKVEQNGNILTIEIPKMLDLRDEWSSRKNSKLGSDSGQTTLQNKRSDPDQEKDINLVDLTKKGLPEKTLFSGPKKFRSHADYKPSARTVEKWRKQRPDLDITKEIEACRAFIESKPELAKVFWDWNIFYKEKWIDKTHYGKTKKPAGKPKNKLDRIFQADKVVYNDPTNKLFIDSYNPLLHLEKVSGSATSLRVIDSGQIIEIAYLNIVH